MAMRIRKTNVLVALGVVVGVLFMLYLIIDTINLVSSSIGTVLIVLA